MINIEIYDNEDAAETQAQVFRNMGRDAQVVSGSSILVRDQRNGSLPVDDPSEVWVVVAC